MRVYKTLFAALLCLFVWQGLNLAQDASLETAKSAYDKGDNLKSIEILKSAASKEPANGEIQLLLTKAYLASDQYDAAVNSAEKAVSLDPKNSTYHQWLGEAYWRQGRSFVRIQRVFLGTQNAKGIRNRGAAERTKLRRATGPDRIRLYRPVHCWWWCGQGAGADPKTDEFGRG